jgi:hypothetical protein
MLNAQSKDKGRGNRGGRGGAVSFSYSCCRDSTYWKLSCTLVIEAAGKIAKGNKLFKVETDRKDGAAKVSTSIVYLSAVSVSNVTVTSAVMRELSCPRYLINHLIQSHFSHGVHGEGHQKGPFSGC